MFMFCLNKIKNIVKQMNFKTIKHTQNNHKQKKKFGHQITLVENIFILKSTSNTE